MCMQTIHANQIDVPLYGCLSRPLETSDDSICLLMTEGKSMPQSQYCRRKLQQIIRGV